MIEGLLRGCHVLVVEDEFMLAEDMSQELAEAGAIVIGPAQSLERAIELLAASGIVDAAVLDVNLQVNQYSRSLMHFWSAVSRSCSRPVMTPLSCRRGSGHRLAVRNLSIQGCCWRHYRLPSSLRGQSNPAPF